MTSTLREVTGHTRVAAKAANGTLGAVQLPAAETVGERIRRIRLEQGLSQRDLAAPGVSYAYVSRIEAGTRTPSAKALQALADKLDCTALYLATGHEEARCPFCGRAA